MTSCLFESLFHILSLSLSIRVAFLLCVWLCASTRVSVFLSSVFLSECVSLSISESVTVCLSLSHRLSLSVIVCLCLIVSLCVCGFLSDSLVVLSVVVDQIIMFSGWFRSHNIFCRVLSGLCACVCVRCLCVWVCVSLCVSLCRIVCPCRMYGM